MRLPRKAAMPAPLEKDVQAAVIEYLRFIGAFVIRINSGGMTGDHKGKSWFVRFNDQPGCSDLLSVLPDGRFAAWEAKRTGWKYKPPLPGETVSKQRAHEHEQSEFLASVRRRGGIGEFVTGIADVRRVLLDEGYDAP